MKRKSFLNRSSIISTLDFIIAPTGINSMQASIAYHTVVGICNGILQSRQVE